MVSSDDSKVEKIRYVAEQAEPEGPDWFRHVAINQPCERPAPGEHLEHHLPPYCDEGHRYRRGYDKDGAVEDRLEARASSSGGSSNARIRRQPPVPCLDT